MERIRTLSQGWTFFKVQLSGTHSEQELMEAMEVAALGIK